jgi:GntR family transcriptional regulator
MSAQAFSVPRDSRFDTALAALRREVLTGRFKDSDMLPGERELSDLFTVSRTTLRRVLATLVEDGMLTHRQGVGTFVRRALAPAHEITTPLTGFTEDMRLRGFRASSRDIERGVFLPTPEDAMMLGCSPSDNVIRLSRIRYADDVPIVVEHAVVPQTFLDDPDRIGPSLYGAFERRGLRPVRALQRVQAVIVSDQDARRLGVPPASAALHIRRTAYLPDGRCCEFTRSTYRSDRYDVVSELRGASIAPRDLPR